MKHGDGVVMIGHEWADWTKSPASRRARRAGATIAKELADEFYGERSYIAVDLDGHHWTFSQTIKQVSTDEMTKVTGCKYKKL